MTCAAHALAASRRMLVAEDVDLIQELVGLLPPRSGGLTHLAIDLGAGSGTTALSVFAASPAIQVTTIDRDEEAMGWAELAVMNAGFRWRWTRIIDSAANVADTFYDLVVDLLLHDAGHGYDDVKSDLLAWLPLLSSDGFVWVHDYGDPKKFGLPSEREHGVKKAVDELVRDGVLKPYKIHGLGWAGRKATADDDRVESNAAIVGGSGEGTGEGDLSPLPEQPKNPATSQSRGRPVRKTASASKDHRP